MSRTFVAAMWSMLIVACGGEQVLPASLACEEQAVAMCGTQRPTLDPWPIDTCYANYFADCIPGNAGVGIEEHVACLDALAHREVITCVPMACVNTWGDPGRVAHFCRD